MHFRTFIFHILISLPEFVNITDGYLRKGDIRVESDISETDELVPEIVVDQVIRLVDGYH